MNVRAIFMKFRVKFMNVRVFMNARVKLMTFYVRVKSMRLSITRTLFCEIFCKSAA